MLPIIKKQLRQCLNVGTFYLNGFLYKKKEDGLLYQNKNIFKII